MQKRPEVADDSFETFASLRSRANTGHIPGMLFSEFNIFLLSHVWHQTEFYELQSLGKIPGDALTAVPMRISALLSSKETLRLKADNEKLKSLAGYVFPVLIFQSRPYLCSDSPLCLFVSVCLCVSKARGMWDKLRKERDHHRMHHRRVAQEKDKLLNDLRRLKTHIEGCDSVAALSREMFC